MTGVLALDFGGTKIAVGIADRERREWLRLERVPAPDNAADGMEAALRLTDGIITELGIAIDSIGVSFGGHVDSTSGVVARSMQVRGWEGFPLAATLAEHFAAPARVLNDGAAGALGEWHFGAGSGLQDVVYLTISTGIGGGVVLGGLPYDGSTGLAAEFGHLPVPGADVRCTCGSTGCLEAVAAGPAIARQAEQAVATGVATTLSGPAGSITAQTVSEHARAGDRVARELLESAGRAIGAVSSIVVTCFDPQAVIIGGGVAKAGEPLWSGLKESFREPLRDERWVKVTRAEHVDDAPLYGALSLALSEPRRRTQERV